MRTLDLVGMEHVSGGSAPHEDGGGDAEPRMLTGWAAFQAYGIVRFARMRS
jgi:hypothetical protein